MQNWGRTRKPQSTNKEQTKTTNGSGTTTTQRLTRGWAAGGETPGTEQCWRGGCETGVGGENQGGEELRNTREREVESDERLKLPNKTGNKETKNQKQDVRLEVIYQHRTSGNKSTKPEQKSALTLYITSLLQFWGTCFTKYESTYQLHVVMSI